MKTQGFGLVLAAFCWISLVSFAGPPAPRPAAMPASPSPTPAPEPMPAPVPSADKSKPIPVARCFDTFKLQSALCVLLVPRDEREACFEMVRYLYEVCLANYRKLPTSPPTSEIETMD